MKSHVVPIHSSCGPSVRPGDAPSRSLARPALGGPKNGRANSAIIGIVIRIGEGRPDARLVAVVAVAAQEADKPACKSGSLHGHKGEGPGVPAINTSISAL
ncbi:hypothetical protein KM043_016425 [Ampulex compressa]|nr:hypothetical protein KM043_016425 [Ampulex compressa]